MNKRTFIHGDFLLGGDAARRLYHEFAAGEPILDYHCHLSPRDIAEDRQFKNLSEIWLEGDHYKWRAMRANGVPERFCTGDATPREKFQAWAATVPQTLRNPLYHWTHLELARYFGITELLDETSAGRIWDQANEQLATPELSARGILRKFGVTTLCTTDDPADDLRHHEEIAASGLTTRVRPAFRPDAALTVHRPESFNAWLARMEKASGVGISALSGMPCGGAGTFSMSAAAGFPITAWTDATRSRAPKPRPPPSSTWPGAAGRPRRRSARSLRRS